MFAKRKKGRSGWGIFTRERRPRNSARAKRLRLFEPLEPRLMLATDVSGAVEGVWNLAGSPYRLVGHTTVEQGKTLTIEPGVVVSAGTYRDGWPAQDYIYDFTVNGTVNVTDASFTEYTDLLVRNGGTLNLTGATVSGGNVSGEGSRVEFQAGGSGQISGSTFNIPVYQYSGS